MTSAVPGDDEQARVSVAALHSADRAAASAGITVLEVAAGRAVVRMMVTEAMLNGHGTCHGGFVFLLADVAFAYACNTTGIRNVAAAAEITYVAPVEPNAVLLATAVRRVHFGRDGRQGFYDVTVTDESSGTVLALFTGRSARVG